MIKSSDRELAELRFGSGHGQKKTTKNNNKSRAEQEPRSAHGRAVKNNKSRVKQEPRSAHGRAVNKWAVNIFAEWQRLRGVKGPVLDCGGLFKDYDLHKVTAVSVDIAGMDALSLNYWLSKFVMEVAKKSGERYPPKSVYGIICALKRYLEEKNGSEALNPLDASDKRYLTTFRPNWLVI